MKTAFALLLNILLSALPGAQARPLSPPPPAQLAPIVIRDVTVIDATGAPAKPNMSVVITGGRITALGKTGRVRVPKNARMVDGTGKFLIPGLWDMHVHWYLKDYLPLFIANGVTGVRIMLGGGMMHHEWRKEIENGTLLGPKMAIASPIVDGPKPVWPNSLAVSSGLEARETVRTIKQGGWDFIKVYNLIPRDAYFALANEAKEQGLSFVGHTPFSVTVAEASDAGQKSIEHLTGVYLGCSREEASLRKNLIEALARVEPKPDISLRARHNAEMKSIETYDNLKATKLFTRFTRNRTWQVPTLTVQRTNAFIDDVSFTNDERLIYLPPSIKEHWNSKDNVHTKNRTAEDYENRKRLFRKQLELVGAMRRAGVEFLAGTDVANPYCFPGFSLHDELGLFVQAGLTPMEALQTATLNPARFLGKEKELGTVEKGKIADLILLDANPLADINNTKRIAAVLVGGRLFDREQLDVMLAKVEKLASLKSIADTLFETIDKQNVAVAIQQYRDLKAKESDAYDFSEDELSKLGYWLLEAKKIKEAIEIFKLNVEVYPRSWNTYDGLADGYLANGDKELAIKNLKKLLELNPQHTNAIEMLKKLGAK